MQATLTRRPAAVGLALLRWPGGSGARLAFLALLAAFAYLVVPPLVVLVQTSLSDSAREGQLTLDNYWSVLDGLFQARILVNTVVFAAGSSALSFAVGTALAWLTERTNAPFRGLVYTFAFAAFAFPGIIQTIGWILLLGPNAGFLNLVFKRWGLPAFDVYSLPGMVLVEAAVWVPVVFLLMAVPFRSMDPSLEEAALANGANRWQALLRVTLRLAAPSALAVFLLTVVRAFEAFEIPAIIGLPGHVTVLTSQVYLKLKSGVLPNYGQASAYAVVLLAAVIPLLAAYHRLTRGGQRFATITGRGVRPAVIDLGRGRALAGAALLLLPGLLLLPLSLLAWASVQKFYAAPSLAALGQLTLDNFPKAFANSAVRVSLGNSLLVGAASATLLLALALAASWLVARGKVHGAWSLDTLGSLPLVFPSAVLGVALLRFYLAVPLPVYGTLLILVAAYMTRFMPYGMRFCLAGLLSIHKDLEDGAVASGANAWQTFRRVLLPLLMPPICSAWIYVFLLASRELTTALLLYSPRSEVIAVAIFQLWSNGQITEVAAFSLVITAILVTLALGFQRLSERFSWKAA
jgi:iron(III) transport system permease protein